MDKPIPSLYVKLLPLACWGSAFNYSIWYVELGGEGDPARVAAVQAQYRAHLQHQSWRLCLKFLREQPHMQDAFHQLQQRTQVILEDPLASELFEQIVQRGDCRQAECTLAAALQQRQTPSPSLFNEHIEERVPYRARWARISTALMPQVRGGHQMCWDPQGVDGHGAIYLLGGWDGHKDLGDFWRFSPASGEWTRLSDDTRLEGGPGTRSCHKMLINVSARQLYILGKYIDTESRAAPVNLTNDLFSYHLESGQWSVLCRDVGSKGGPGLIYDHQMAVDEEGAVLYVFGGRLIPTMPIQGSSSSSIPESTYSGLYAFNLATGQWRQIRGDFDLIPGTPTLKSRIGHSMLFDPITRKLLIFAGTRLKESLADFYVYSVEQDKVVEMCKDVAKAGGPEPGLTQRATLDTHRREMFLLSSVVRDRSSVGPATPSGGGAAHSPTSPLPLLTGTGAITESPRNYLWSYHLVRRTWSLIYSSTLPSATSDSLGASAASSPVSESEEEPRPRYAHQLVYDPLRQIHYLFGGNPGEVGNPRRRLNDFWSLQLQRTRGPEDILRRATFLLRRQCFRELCAQRSPTPGSPSMLNAMRFLQQEVSQAVCHGDPEESREFAALSGWLLGPPGGDQHEARVRLFSEIVALLPRAMQPPPTSISDFVL